MTSRKRTLVRKRNNVSKNTVLEALVLAVLKVTIYEVNC
jgi:hypothetical protein